MIGIPTEVIPRQSKSVIFFIGENGFFDCPIKGSLPPVIQYLVKKSPIRTDNSHYKAFTNGTLMIINVSKFDAGSYTCKSTLHNVTNKTTVLVEVYGKHSYLL